MISIPSTSSNLNVLYIVTQRSNLLFKHIIAVYTLREENKFGSKECGIKDCELDL